MGENKKEVFDEELSSKNLLAEQDIYDEEIPVYDILMEQRVEELCVWAAARAAAVVVMPFVGTVALIANEVYLVKKIGDLHGQQLSESVILGFIASLGASVVGSTLATLFPYSPTKLLIGATITYGVGKSAHEWLKAGRPDDHKIFKKVFQEAKDDIAKNIKKVLTHPGKDKPLGDEEKKFEE